MRELNTLIQQCEEMEKLAQDIQVEAFENGIDSIEELSKALEENTIEMSKQVDIIKSILMGEIGNVII